MDGAAVIARLLWLCCLAVAVLPAWSATYSFRSDSYAWETASTALTWARACTAYPGDDDQATISFSGGLVFRFAGVDYASVRVLTNGSLQFGADTGFMRNYTNTALPAGTATTRSGCTATATARTIMAYWTDLDPSRAGSGGVTWEQKGTAPNRYVVISWNGVYQYNTSTPYTFQIVLYEGGEFKFQYGNANATGANATIGVQVGATDYTLYSYNSGYNANGAAIRWFVGSNTPTRLAEYRFDEYTYTGTLGEVRDSSGNGRAGVRLGSAASHADGVVCRALDVPANTTSTVSGVDTLVSVPGSLGNAGGVTFWYRSAAAWNSGTAAMLLDARATGSGDFFLMRDTAGRLRFVVSDTARTAHTVLGTAQTFAAGTWVHVAVTWRLAAGSNATTTRIYVNGVLNGSQVGTTNGSINAALLSLVAGDSRVNSTSNSTTLNSANGRIDELRLYNYEIGLSDIAADRAATHDCLPPVDHFQLVLPASTLACLGSTVTVTACADGSSPCTTPSAALAGQTVRLGLSGGGSLGATTLTLGADGTASTTLSHPGAADGDTVSVSVTGSDTPAVNGAQCCPDGASCTVAASCSTRMATAGFIVAGAAGGGAATPATQVAGTNSATHWLRAVRTGTDTAACTAALTGSQVVEWAYQCVDPATCSPGQRMTITGAASATVPGNPLGGVTSLGPVTMSFDAEGNAPFTFRYADVGRVLLHARKSGVGQSTTPMTGQSGAFVTRPHALTVSALQQTAAPGRANPAATSAAGGVFVAAGEAFTATVTATGSDGAATPNFGRESTPVSVTLGATLVQPAGGTTGALSNATIAGGSFSGGAATVTQLSYAEVGIVTLAAALPGGSYLGSTGTLAPASVNVGRFVPASFALSGGSVTHRAGLACSPASDFSYLGESFRLGFTLTARNAAGATTRNYTGSFARLDPTQASSLRPAGLAGATVFSTGNGRLALGSASGSWNAGVATGIALTLQATRGSAPEGPFDAAFGVAPVDPDGVALAGHDLDTDGTTAGAEHTRVGAVALRFGRLRLLSAAGAADRGLALPVRAEAWDGSAFAPNELDSCTQVPAAAVSLGNLRRTLTTADTVVGGPVVLNAGRGSLRLAAPAGGRSGTVDVALSLGSTATDASCLQPWTPGSGDTATVGANLSYLRGAWCGSDWTNDPSARASFGLPRGRVNTLYRRENY